MGVCKLLSHQKSKFANVTAAILRREQAKQWKKPYLLSRNGSNAEAGM